MYCGKLRIMIWRIGKNQIKFLTVIAVDPVTYGRANQFSTIIDAEHIDIVLQDFLSDAIALHEHDVIGATTERFKPDRASAGEHVENVCACDTALQPIEKCFAHAVAGWAKAGLVEHGDLAATPLTRDDADASLWLALIHRA